MLTINLLFQLYCASFILNVPLVGITIKQDAEQRWLIENIQDDSWGSTVSLVVGQEVTQIDGVDISPNTKNELTILQAHNIKVLEGRESKIYPVSYESLTGQLVKHLLIPIIYILVTSVLCVYLVT